MTRTAILVLLLCLGAVQLQAQKAPKIRASETGWEFGIRTQGDKEIKSITIYNDGDELLKIHDIKVTCGCVKAEMKQREIEPGKSTELELVLTTYNTVGSIQKHCYLYNNDPKMPQLVLTVRGEIRGDWELEKTQLNFGSCEAGMTYEQTVRVLHRRGEKLELRSYESVDPNLEISATPFSETVKEEQVDEISGAKRMVDTVVKGWILKVKLLDSAPAGPFAAAVAVKSSHRLTPLQNLMVYAKLEGPVTIQPLGKMHMGRVFEGAQARRSLKINIDDGNGYMVTGVTVDCPAVEVRITEVDPGRTWDVEFVVTGRKGDGNMNETAVINTSHPLQPVIKIPIDWVCRPPVPGRQGP